MSFYSDTENVNPTKNISDLINQQLPSFIRDEADDFTEFLQKYYEWMESHELIINDSVQNEFVIKLDDISSPGSLLLETGGELTLESERNAESGFIQGEKIIGLTTGAVGFVDRNTKISDNIIFPKNVTVIDFEPGETITGQSSRVSATVHNYYKNPLFASRTLIKERDIDTTTTTFIKNFEREFLSDLPTNLKGEKPLMMKHIVDVYRAKGSKASYDFLFKTLYDIQDLEYYAPKDDLWKASDGQWVADKTLRLTTFDPVSEFEGRVVTGRKSFATGEVDRVLTFASGALSVTELFLKNLNGTFVIGEDVDSTMLNGKFGTGKVQGVITKIEVENPGTEYKIGDVVEFAGGGGTEASAVVKTIASGTINEVIVHDGGDGYVRNLPLSVNNFGTFGSGLEGKITDIQESFSIPVCGDKIIDHFYKRIDSTSYGMGGNPLNNVQHSLIETLGFVHLHSGVITDTKITTVGINYLELPKVHATYSNTAELTTKGVTSILNLNPDPDDFGRTNAITGTFVSGERLVSNTGDKIGTFYRVVSDPDVALTLSDPIKIRMKNYEYLGIYNIGADDITPNISSYVNDSDTIYDVKVTTQGQTTKNKFVYRRGLNSLNSLITYDPSTEPVYSNIELEMTGGFQKLTFPIDSISQTGGTATVVAYGRHGLTDGQKVIISNVNPSAYNGEKTITVSADTPTQFTFPINEFATSPGTVVPGETMVYDENVSVKFGMTYKHANGDDFPNVPDRYLIGTSTFEANDVITGFTSGAKATVANSGSVFDAFPGFAGNNVSIMPKEASSEAGSIGSIELLNPGVGFTTSPTATMLLSGDGTARFNVSIGAVGDVYGQYFDENGFIGYGKKIIDSNFYQDYSYSLRSSKQLNDYEQAVKKLLHPVGTKIFGEFRPEGESLNLGFENTIILEDGSFIQIENSFDKLLTEQYFEPTHNIRLQTVKDAPNSVGLTIKGGSKTVFDPDNTENLPIDYPANTTVIIDDEQAFTVSYGELKLENFKNGRVGADSQNNVTRFLINNTSASFSGSGEVTQTKTDGTTVVGSFLSSETNPQGNNVLMLHTCNGIFESSSNLDFTNTFGNQTANLYSAHANVLFGNTHSIEIPDIISLERDNVTRTVATITTLSNHNLRQKDVVTVSGVNKTMWNGTFIVTVLSDKSFQYTAFSILDIGDPEDATNNLDFSKATFKIQRGTDFQNDFVIGDVLILNNTSEQAEITQIINSSCVVANTRINSDSSYNMTILDDTDPQGILLLEDGNEFELDTRIPNLSSIDKLDDDSYFTMEQSVKGTTNTNGIQTGLSFLFGFNSQFEKDLTIGDVIVLSSNTSHEAEIVSITERLNLKISNSALDGSDANSDFLLENGTLLLMENSQPFQRLELNVGLGDGTTNQKIILKSTRNLDLETTANSLTLHAPYDGSNNFVRIHEQLGRFENTGLLLLEDGIAPSNAQYVGTVSLEGSFKFENQTSFSNQTMRIIS